MKTRKQYLNKECTHREYYSQFVNDWVKQQVSSHIGMEALRDSKDQYFNDTTNLKTWDRMSVPSSAHNLMKKAGDYVTLSAIVCINKEAGRQLLESEAQL